MSKTIEGAPKEKPFMHRGPLRRAVGILSARIVRGEIKAGKANW